MESLLSIALLTLILILYGIYEYTNHQKHLSRIPIRIHVNGTRGKSSVTRLIGAGLRAGGYNTITKVTGTFPRMILGDGTEVAVHRKEKANILEQLDIVKYCADKGADVLLIECMALNPIYQRITEHQMVKATHGVITNIRLDHLDVMGPGLQNVADALSLTIPRKSKLFTSEDRLLGFIKKKAKRLKTDVAVADGSDVTTEDMKGFTYFEHPQNVSLALSICDSLEIDRTQALAAMKKSIPDEGVLRKFTIQADGHFVHFYNALAANDPESSLLLWSNIRKMESDEKTYIMLINCRKDRKERSEQLVNAATQVHFDHLVLTGENVELVKTIALKAGIAQQKLKLVGQASPEDQTKKISDGIDKEAIIVAFGNMGAGGAELSKYFENNHIS